MRRISPAHSNESNEASEVAAEPNRTRVLLFFLGSGLDRIQFHNKMQTSDVPLCLIAVVRSASRRRLFDRLVVRSASG